jgi:hypothetical protein
MKTKVMNIPAIPEIVKYSNFLVFPTAIHKRQFIKIIKYRLIEFPDKNLSLILIVKNKKMSAADRNMNWTKNPFRP